MAAAGLLLRAMARSLRTGAGMLVDLVYPPSCAACGKETEPAAGHGLCRSCSDALPLLSRIPCPGCGGAPVPSPGVFCGCGGASFRRDGLVAALSYAGPARDLIFAFKYRADLAAGAVLAELLLCAPGLADIPRPQVVVPVPLHPRRLRERGFNQAALLARRAAAALGSELAPRLLSRRRPTAPLSGLGPAKRRLEVRGAITVRRPELVRDRQVLLVDDILTTGVTVEECCRALGEAGASAVFAAVAARKLKARALH